MQLDLPIPKIKNKVIYDHDTNTFEWKLDEFIDGLDSYSIQYKPVVNSGRIFCTALVTYPVPEEGEEDV
jgi:hypothetical protein